MFILIIFLGSIQANAEDAKMPGLGISNKCEITFPIESRENYNQPQYKLGYDRCMNAYNAYVITLKNTIEEWKLAIQTNKLEDWEKVSR